MAIPFSQNVTEALAYSNSSLKTFSNWLLTILMTVLVVFGVLVTVCGISLITASAFLAGIPESFSIIATIISVFCETLVEIFNAFTSSLMTAGIILTVVGIIVTALFSFWLTGVMVRGASPEEVTLAKPGKLLGQGFFANIIMLVYFIPAIILSIIICLGPMDNEIYFALVGIIVQGLIYCLCGMAGYMAIAAYANEGRLGAAFSIPSVCSAITRFGWLRFLGHFLLFSLLAYVVLMIIAIIPIIGLLLLLFAVPFLEVLTGRFFGNIYRSVQA